MHRACQENIQTALVESDNGKKTEGIVLPSIRIHSVWLPIVQPEHENLVVNNDKSNLRLISFQATKHLEIVVLAHEGCGLTWHLGFGGITTAPAL